MLLGDAGEVESVLGDELANDESDFSLESAEGMTSRGCMDVESLLSLFLNGAISPSLSEGAGISASASDFLFLATLRRQNMQSTMIIMSSVAPSVPPTMGPTGAALEAAEIATAVMVVV